MNIREIKVRPITDRLEGLRNGDKFLKALATPGAFDR